MREKWSRSLIKAVLWRCIATGTTLVVSLFMTGSIAIAGSIASIGFVVKLILYYIHERIWNRIKAGFVDKEQSPCVLWFTGLSGSGKTTLADAVAVRLSEMGYATKRVDGDVGRKSFSANLGFTKEDRDKNIERAAAVASYEESQGNIVLASFISPYQSQRCMASQICNKFLEIYVKCSLNGCKMRDPKKLYARLENGCFKGSPFTGVHPDAPYEKPTRSIGRPNTYVIDTEYNCLDTCVDKIIDILLTRQVIHV